MLPSLSQLPDNTGVEYNFDRVVFISDVSPEELAEKLPVDLLAKHCKLDGDGKLIRSNRRGSNNFGWETELSVSACDDFFMQEMGLCKDATVTHLEIAMNVVFDSMEHAEEYARWFELIVERRYSRYWFKFKGTLYLGKEQGDNRKNYFRCYTSKTKKTEAEREIKPCFHSEFVLEGSQTIRNALKIQERIIMQGEKVLYYPAHSQIPTARECFYQLENSLLRYRGFRTVKGQRFGSLYIPLREQNRIRERILRARPVC